MTRLGHFPATGVCLAIAVGLVGIISSSRSANTHAYRLADPTREDWLDYAADSDDGDEFDAGVRAECQGKTCAFRSSCGLAPLNKMTRSSVGPYILNGEDQTPGEWPSFAFLRVNYLKGQNYRCAGVLVSDQHVITAAKCVMPSVFPLRKARDDDPTQFDDVDVHLGVHQLGLGEKSLFQTKASSVHVGKRVWKNAAENDWAVLTLADRVKFNNHIQPACLPDEATSNPARYRKCYSVGPGEDRPRKGYDGTYAKVVQKMPVQQVSCKPHYFNHKTKACYAKAGSNGTACFGDYGSPILCMDTTTKRWTAVAIASEVATSCNYWSDYVAQFGMLAKWLPDIKAETGL